MDAPPFSLKGINHVLLLVTGMQRSLDFYQSVIGCEIEMQLPQYGMAELRAGSSHLDLVDVDAKEGAWAKPEITGGRNVDHVAIGVHYDDEAALRKHLASNGVEIVEERIEQTADGSALSLYVRDPSGNTIELISV